MTDRHWSLALLSRWFLIFFDSDGGGYTPQHGELAIAMWADEGYVVELLPEITLLARDSIV